MLSNTDFNRVLKNIIESNTESVTDIPVEEVEEKESKKKNKKKTKEPKQYTPMDQLSEDAINAFKHRLTYGKYTSSKYAPVIPRGHVWDEELRQWVIEG